MGSQLPGSQGLEGQNEGMYPKEMKQEPDINLRACWWREKQGEEEEEGGGFDFWPQEEQRCRGREQRSERPTQKAQVR